MVLCRCLKLYLYYNVLKKYIAYHFLCFVLFSLIYDDHEFTREHMTLQMSDLLGEKFGL